MDFDGLDSDQLHTAAAILYVNGINPLLPGHIPILGSKIKRRPGANKLAIAARQESIVEINIIAISFRLT